MTLDQFTNALRETTVQLEIQSGEIMDAGLSK